MARTTSQDCLEHIPNQFDLVLVAGKHAKSISADPSMAPLFTDHQRQPEKPSMIALREIAQGKIPARNLHDYHQWMEQKKAAALEASESLASLTSEHSTHDPE